MENQKVKSIAFKITLKGKGVVQYNGTDVPYIDYEGKDYETAKNKNLMLAKRNYHKTGRKINKDGNEKDIIVGDLKYSSDFARHGIHIQEHRCSMPAGIYEGNKELRIKHLANLGTLQRGWLLPNNGKRKSPYIITDLKEISGAVIGIDVCSSRTIDISTGKRADTSLFGREQIGDSEFVGDGYIDVAEMGFISLSKIHDREALVEDDANEFKMELAKNIKSVYERLVKKGYKLEEPENVISEPAYYRKGEWDTTIPEKGIQLTEKQNKVLIYDLLDKMTMIYAQKSQGAYIKSVLVEVKAVSNPIAEDFNNTYVKFGIDYSISNLDCGYITNKEYAEEYELSLDAIKKAEADAKSKKDKKSNKKNSETEE